MLFLATSWSQKCPSSWTLSESGKKCLKLIDNSSNWVEAQNRCEYINGSLLDAGADEIILNDMVLFIQNLSLPVFKEFWVNAHWIVPPQLGPVFQFQDGEQKRIWVVLVVFCKKNMFIN